MLPEWQEVIEDPDEQKVFQSLADPRWDFRTIEGIARETGLTGEAIETVIKKHLASGLIRESLSLSHP